MDVAGAHELSTLHDEPETVSRRRTFPSRCDGPAIGLVTLLCAAPPWIWVRLGHTWIGTLDSPGSAWVGWAWGQQWMHGSISRTIDAGIHPVGIDLGLIDGQLPHGVVALLSFAGPFWGYNLALGIGVALSGWAAHRLTRLVASRIPAALIALVLAASPVMLAPARVHLTFAWSWPATMLIAHVITTRRTTPKWWVLGLLGATALLCSAYHLVFGLGAALVLGVGFALVDRPINFLALRSLALGAIAALAVCSPLIAARLSYASNETDAGSRASDQRRLESAVLSSDTLDALWPDPNQRVTVDRPDSWPPGIFGDIQSSAWGWALGGLVVFSGGSIGWHSLDERRRRRATASPEPLLATVGRRRMAVVMCTGALWWLFSLGPTVKFAGANVLGSPGEWSPMPFARLASLPGLTALRAPYRVGFTLAPLVAVCVAWMVQRLWNRTSMRTHIVLTAVVLAAAAASLLTPLTSSLDVDLALRRELATVAADDSSRSVMTFPFRCPGPKVTTLNILHRHPMVDCSVGTSMTPWFSRLNVWFDNPGMQAAACHDTVIGPRLLNAGGASPQMGTTEVDALRTGIGVRWLIVDRSAATAPGCERQAAAIAAWEMRGVLVGDVLDLDRLAALAS